MKFADLQGRQLTWADSLSETYTDGIIVMHRGKRVYERYVGALQAQRRTPAFDYEVLCGHIGGNADSRARLE